MTCDSYWPEHGECNGHGTCYQGQCICDSGWSGVSDVVGEPVMNCHVHITTVAVLWGIQALMTAILILICLRRFFRLYSWGVFSNPKYWRSLTTQAASRVLWLVTFIASCWLALSIYKLSHLPDPPPAIGHNLISTILYVTGIVGFYAMLLNNIWMWQAVVIPIHFMANHPQIKRIFFLVRVLGFFTFISTTTSFHILYAIYVYPEYQNELGATFWLARGSFLLAYVVVDQLFAKKLVKVLQDSFKSVATTRVATTGPTNNDEDMDKLVAGVKSYMGSNLFSGGVTIVICLVAGVWPFVRGLGAYIFPLSLSIPVLAGFSLMRTIPDSPGSFGRGTPSNSVSRSRHSQLNSPPSPQQKPLSPRQSQMTYGGRPVTRETSGRASQLVRHSSASQENLTNTTSSDDIVRPLPDADESTVNNFDLSAQSPSVQSKQSSFITLVPLSASSSSDSIVQRDALPAN